MQEVYYIREDIVDGYYTLLDSSNKVKEKQAVQKLVSGCLFHKRYSQIHKYFLERVFGYCRSLESADLRYANLYFAGLNYADLRYADLRYADLRFASLFDSHLHTADFRSANLRNVFLNGADLNGADFRSADLSSANLSSAYLSSANFRSVDLSSANLSSAFLGSANLSSANLSSANLSFAFLGSTYLSSANLNGAIFLATDLRDARELTKQQLEGENQPYICNSPLPNKIEIKGGKDRDCNKLADILHQRDSWQFNTPEAAAEFVKKQRQKTWE